jgi:DNA-binding transcriptional regulator YiaG
MKFPTQLKASRLKAKLTIPGAAREFGVSPRTWSYWEAGVRPPPSQSQTLTQERILKQLSKLQKCL